MSTDILNSNLILYFQGKMEGYGTFDQLVPTIASLEQSTDLTSDDLDTDSEDSDMDEPSTTSSNHNLNIVECSYKYCRRYSYYPQPVSINLIKSRKFGICLSLESIMSSFFVTEFLGTSADCFQRLPIALDICRSHFMSADRYWRLPIALYVCRLLFTSTDRFWRSPIAPDVRRSHTRSANGSRLCRKCIKT